MEGGLLVSHRRRRAALVVMLLALAAPVPSLAAGPWQALVVDAETQAPLEGVAVLARWHRRAQGHPAIGLGRRGFHSAAETASGGDGRFRIPARMLFNPPLVFPIEGPEIALFKAGYGGWKLRGPARDLAGPDVVIEMRPLATDAERLSYLEGQWQRADRQALTAWQSGESPANPSDVPYEEAARYEAAINAARAALGCARSASAFRACGLRTRRRFRPNRRARCGCARPAASPSTRKAASTSPTPITIES
jgi:hypothetical protein